MTLPGIEVDPGRGDVDAVRDLSRLFQVRADALTGRAESGRAALGAMEGLASLALDELRVQVATMVDKFGSAADAATQTSGILGDYAATLDGIQSRARWLYTDARAAYDRVWWRRSQALNEASELVTGWALDWDEVLASWMYFDDPGYLLRWQGAIDDYRDARARFLALQTERDDLDSRTTSRLRGIGLLGELAPSHGVIGRAASAALWAGDAEGITAEGLAGLDDPELIRQVWDALGSEQQAALIAAAPLVIGNLNGIPLRDRITANRINIRDEIKVREARIDDLEQQKADALRPAYTGKEGVEEVYDRLIAEQQDTIDYYQSLLDQQVRWRDEHNVRHTDTGARVVVFDPGKKAIATYQGAIDPVTGDIPSWVQNVAVSVPGMETRMTSFSDQLGRYLYEAASDAGPSAVFQWAGGEFPGGGVPEGTVQAMDSSYAERLAPRLRDFAAAIQVPAGAELTVVGHSYGGATVGLAEKAGLSADRIMYVSAAGMGHGVDGLQDFPNTKDVPHYALMARDDLVVGPIQGQDGTAMHGRSPLDAEGVIRLETGFVRAGDASSGTLERYDLPEGGMPAPVDAHSTVLQRGTGAFQNVVAVITGGRAELYAPDVTVMMAGHQAEQSGLDAQGYTPQYVEVR